jgi:hypothetical protein
MLNICSLNKSPKCFISKLTFLGFIFINGISVIHAAINDPNAMYDVLIEGIRENSQKLKCTSLIWNLSEKREEPNSDYPASEGIYRLWWDGERIATKSDYDIIVGSEETGWHKVGNEKSYKVYDGEEFRVVDDVNEPLSIGLDNKPTFSELENWFEHIRWPGHNRSIIYTMNLSKNKKEIQYNWSIVKKDGSELAKRVFRNINSKEDIYEVEYYDLLKGCNLVCYEKYYNGKMYLKETTTLHLVSGGCWFPVETNFNYVYPHDSSTTIHRILKIDLEKSSFNDISAIPDDIFEIEITNNMRIIDQRSGETFIYTKDMTPLVMDELEKATEEFMAEDRPSTPNELNEIENFDTDNNIPEEPMQTKNKKKQSDYLLNTTSGNKKIIQVTLISIGTVLIIIGALRYYLMKRKKPSNE